MKVCAGTCAFPGLAPEDKDSLTASLRLFSGRGGRA